MTNHLERIAISLRAIAVAEGIAHPSLGTGTAIVAADSLEAVLAKARRLQRALGGNEALTAAATNTSTWPTLASFAPRAAHPRELALAAWETLLVPPGSELRLLLGRRHHDAACLSLMAWPPVGHTLRDGLDALLVGAIQSAPLFFGGPPAHVVRHFAGERLTLEVTLPPLESASGAPTSKPASSHVRPRQALFRESSPPVSSLFEMLEGDTSPPPSGTQRVAATCALADGLRLAADTRAIADLARRVLVDHLGFSLVRVWAGPTVRERRLLAATAADAEERLPRPASSTSMSTCVCELRLRGESLGQIELDRQGDVDFARTLAPWIASALGEQLAAELRQEERHAQTAAEAWALTRRQTEVAKLVADGYSNKEIADRLGCTCATVEEHLTAVFRKAAVRGRGELLAALRATEGTPRPSSTRVRAS